MATMTPADQLEQARRLACELEAELAMVRYLVQESQHAYDAGRSLAQLEAWANATVPA